MIESLVAETHRASDQLLTGRMWWLLVVWLFCFGACVGSFLTVVWDRMGTGEGFVYPNSRCPECDHDIRWYHNLPVIGWIILGGRCYDCGSRIPVKRLIYECFITETGRSQRS
jgi:prepilin signal peptidase PulO-like enzyme (type II secretory pathway)